MKFRWLLDPPQPGLAGPLAGALSLPPVLAQCLVNRGFSDAENASQFLAPRLKHLSDPFLLGGMSSTVDRLFQARNADEPLVIFGDYDVDGVTSTALLLETLGALGWKAAHYLPHRRDEGYGLTMDAVATCIGKHPVKLLLAVDCGSSSVESIAWLAAKGVDVIVLDHHQPSNPLPAVRAMVNPRAWAKSPGQPPKAEDVAEEQFQELCSAGLAFKLAHALVKRGRELGIEEAEGYDLRPLLDFVALGAIADVVPLVRENRILVSAGLDRLCDTPRAGLIALKRVAGCGPRIGVYEVGFQLGPRLNAAGRLDTAEDALQLLRARTIDEAMPIALAMQSRNQERQAIERSMVETVLARVHKNFAAARDFVIVEGDPGWHIGVVGIVASRVLQRYYRPTIIFGGDGSHRRGSGRSIAGFDLAGALGGCGDLLVRHGGHAMAAGVTIEPENITRFRERLNQAARSALQPEALRPSLRLDSEVCLDDITPGLLESFDRLRPYGNGNPAPYFLARGVSQQRPAQRMGHEKQHAKLWVTNGSAVREAVWWGAGAESLPTGTLDLAFEPSMNHYNGRSAPQLKVLDWQPAAPSSGAIEMRF